MPKQKRGADKFGVEHEIKSDKDNKVLSSKEVRIKASHYQDKSDY